MKTSFKKIITYILRVESQLVLYKYKPKIIAITGPNCHICKQLIYENALRTGNDILIIIEENKKIKQIPISELMPYPWPEKPTF